MKSATSRIALGVTIVASLLSVTANAVIAQEHSAGKSASKQEMKQLNKEADKLANQAEEAAGRGGFGHGGAYARMGGPGQGGHRVTSSGYREFRRKPRDGRPGAFTPWHPICPRTITSDPRPPLPTRSSAMRTRLALSVPPAVLAALVAVLPAGSAADPTPAPNPRSDRAVFSAKTIHPSARCR